MSLQPIGDRVLVLPDEADDTTESGLILVSATDHVAMSGTVAFLGLGPRCGECGGPIRRDVQIGDRVVFAPNHGSEVQYDGVTYLVLPEDDILGLVEDE